MRRRYSFPSPPSTPSTPLPPPDTRIGLQHSRFGFFLNEKMHTLGIECIVKRKEDYDGKRAGKMNRDMIEFFLEHFPK